MVKATLADSLGLRQISDAKYLHAPGALYSRLTATLSSTTLFCTVTPRGVELQVPNEVMLDYRTRFDVLAFYCGRASATKSAGWTKEILIALGHLQHGQLWLTRPTRPSPTRSRTAPSTNSLHRRYDCRMSPVEGEGRGWALRSGDERSGL